MVARWREKTIALGIQVEWMDGGGFDDGLPVRDQQESQALTGSELGVSKAVLARRAAAQQPPLAGTVAGTGPGPCNVRGSN